MQDERNPEEREDEEVEAHKLRTPEEAGRVGRAGRTDEEDEVEAHHWANHGPEEPGRQS